MNSLQTSFVAPRDIDTSPNEVDGLMRAFFRAEVPEPWPVLKPPATQSLPRAGSAVRRRSLVRSRFALAACLLILLIGQLVVLARFSGYGSFSADGNRGTIEATFRKTGPVKPRWPRSAPDRHKTEATPRQGGDGILFSGRR